MDLKFPLELAGRHIVVIGAGIIGLSCADALLRSGARVTLVAEWLPGDETDMMVPVEFASAWAGAHWRPHTKRSEAHAMERDWDLQTYREWARIIETEDEEGVPADARAGLAFQTSIAMWDDADHSDIREGGLWYAGDVRDYEPLSCMPAPGVAAAASFTSIAVDVPRYTMFLLRRIRRNARARVVRKRLPTDAGLIGTVQCAHWVARDTWRAQSQDVVVDAVVNATGLGAARMVGDGKMYPVRGQTVLVRGEANAIRTRHGIDVETGQSCISYVIPRKGSGTTVLGGCNEPGRSEREPEQGTTAAILRRCRELCPELLIGGDTSGDSSDLFQIVQVQVGLRPARKGGSRVEREIVDIDRLSLTIVHAYGHGGAGFQNSVGVANRVIALLTDAAMPQPAKI